MKRVTGKTKKRQKRGLGTGKNYNPWIHCREVRSKGTKSLLVDWKHGRQIHLLSRNETYMYFILRWNDDVVDIREQYPLNRTTTNKIADALGITHPRLWNDPNECMTTDFLVTVNENGIEKTKAISVKNSYIDVFGDENKPKVKRRIEIQSIEMNYWQLKGVDFKIKFGDRDINKVFARNIEVIVNYYDLKNVHSLHEFMLYLLAHKYIEVDLEKEPLNVQKLISQYLVNAEQIKNWIAVISKPERLRIEEQLELEKEILNSVIVNMG